MGLISNGTTIFDAGALDSGLAKGAMTFIKKLTASSSGTLSFVNGASNVVLDSTYKEYLFTFNSIHPGADSQHIGFQASTNTGSSYGVATTSTLFRGYHAENDSDSGVAYRADYDVDQGTGFIPLADGISTGADNDQTVSGYIHLFNPSSTTFVKHFMATMQSSGAGAGDSAGASDKTFTAGYFNTTADITAIQFKQSSGNLDSGKIKLYGIKDA